MSNSTSVRSDIVDFLYRELVGPDPGYPAMQLNREEILRPQDPPRIRYSAGVLFPKKVDVGIAEAATEGEVEPEQSAPPEGEETEEATPASIDIGDLDELPDQEVNRANEYLPSAMGLSALVLLPNFLNPSLGSGDVCCPSTATPKPCGESAEHET